MVFAHLVGWGAVTREEIGDGKGVALIWRRGARDGICVSPRIDCGGLFAASPLFEGLGILWLEAGLLALHVESFGTHSVIGVVLPVFGVHDPLGDATLEEAARR